MSEGEEEKITVKGQGWTFALPLSALALLSGLMITVGKDATIALEIARNLQNELISINNRIENLNNEVTKRTQLRYTSLDAARDFEYIKRDIEECKINMKQHHVDLSECSTKLRLHEKEHRN